MKVAVISKSDRFGGGASRVAEELTALLNADGHVAHHWVSWAGSAWTPSMKSLYGRFQLPVRAANLGMRRIGFPELIPFELPTLLWGGRIWDYDVIHFHDLSSAISPQTLLWLSRRKPVAWTIHDCSPYTGGCLYPGSCTRFTSRCGPCPQLGGWPIDSWFDFTGFQQGIKRKLASCGRIHYIAPSHWMAETAMASGLFSTAPELIPYGVDTELFGPRDKSAARLRLGLPADRRIVLLSAGSLMDVRKGLHFAMQALLGVRDLHPFVLLVGAPNPQLRQLLAGFDFHEAGFIGDPASLAEHYAAADVFLFTSLADNLPLTVLETMSTGTPMVGFHTGGIPDMVLQDETGFLVPAGEIGLLTEGLRSAINDPGKVATWREAGIFRARNCFSHRKFLDAHLDLYDRLLTARNTTARQSGVAG